MSARGTREIHLPMLLESRVHGGILVFLSKGKNIAARSIERCALKRVPSDFFVSDFLWLYYSIVIHPCMIKERCVYRVWYRILENCTFS